MKLITITLVVAMTVFSGNVMAAQKLAVLPIGGAGVDPATSTTVHMLLSSEIRQLKCFDIIPDAAINDAMAGAPCEDASCARDIGNAVNADKVVVGSLNRLGEKIIFQYSLIEVSSGKIQLSDDLSALKVEDLDQVAKRIALSICQQIPVDRTVEVGLVTEQETQDVRSRKANATWGIGFGYLYPSHGYDNDDRIFVWDFRSLYELRHISVDAVLGIRQGFALNVGLLYIPSRKDFSPFIGGGVGFHAVSHKDWYQYSYDPYYGSGGYYEEKSFDGFEVVAKAGIMAFRTYDFRLLVNIEYAVVFNEYDDQGFVMTISVMKAGKRVFGIF